MQKNRKDAFWQDRFDVTAMESNRYFGSKSFVENMKEAPGFRATGRKIICVNNIQYTPFNEIERLRPDLPQGFEIIFSKGRKYNKMKRPSRSRGGQTTVEHRHFRH